MTVQDLIITPIYLMLIFLVAFLIRKSVSVGNSHRFFIPGLSLKIFGAIMVGVIYQFYYGGGDTFTYFHLGSKYIWEAFKDNPAYAVKLIFAGREHYPETFQYSSHIYTYGDLASYFVVRVAGVLDIFTLHTYSATAILFAVLSFSGMWAMYQGVIRMYPRMTTAFAIAIFFIPSLFFWGSGLLKDTLTLGALGWFTFALIRLFMFREKLLTSSALLLISGYVLYSIKIYILLSFLPFAMIWIFLAYKNVIRSQLVRIFFIPAVLGLSLLGSFFLVREIGEGSSRYSVEELAYTAEQTAKWNYYVSNRDQGSGYTLGDYDFSPAGIARKAPRAAWLGLFQPYLWQARNPVMLLAGLENFLLLLLFLLTIYRAGFSFFTLTARYPFVLLCLGFSVVFAFAIGITTYNFGSLVRYKIPLIPFFTMGLLLVLSRVPQRKRERKSAATAALE